MTLLAISEPTPVVIHWMVGCKPSGCVSIFTTFLMLIGLRVYLMWLRFSQLNQYCAPYQSHD